MKKKALILILAAALLLSACKSEEQAEASGTTEPVEEITTTTSISALEGAPESTTTEPAYTGEPEIDYPDGFPVPYPVGSVSNEETVRFFTGLADNAMRAESVLHGSQTLIPLGERAGDGYSLIDPEYAGTKGELSERISDYFATYYWSDTYGYELDYLLYEDMSFGTERVRYIDEQLCFYCGADEAQIEYDISTAVVTSADDEYAAVVVLGMLDGEYYWKTFTMINGYRGWVVESTEEEKVSGEIALFSKLLIDNRQTLDKIFGGGDPVLDESGAQVREYVQIADDPYGHGFYYGLEIEPFMTVEEMREYLRETFTGEIAESYISLYVNRSYVEKDGRLFLIEGSVIPQMGSFSLENYQNFTTATFDVTSYVDWTDGANTYTLPITAKYEDGVWKLDTRLPMKADRIIG